MNKSKSERQIERMWFLEHKNHASVEDILKEMYCVKGFNIKLIADYYVQSYGTIQSLLKKYNIIKELIFVD